MGGMWASWKNRILGKPDTEAFDPFEARAPKCPPDPNSSYALRTQCARAEATDIVIRGNGLADMVGDCLAVRLGQLDRIGHTPLACPPNLGVSAVRHNGVDGSEAGTVGETGLGRPNRCGKCGIFGLHGRERICHLVPGCPPVPTSIHVPGSGVARHGSRDTHTPDAIDGALVGIIGQRDIAGDAAAIIAELEYLFLPEIDALDADADMAHPTPQGGMPNFTVAARQSEVQRV